MKQSKAGFNSQDDSDSDKDLGDDEIEAMQAAKLGN